MSIKGHSTFPRVPGEESQDQMLFFHIEDTREGVLLFCRDAICVFYRPSRLDWQSNYVRSLHTRHNTICQLHFQFRSVSGDLRIYWLYHLQWGKIPSTVFRVRHSTVSSSEALVLEFWGSVNYHFIVITPRFSLISSYGSYYRPIYG